MHGSCLLIVIIKHRRGYEAPPWVYEVFTMENFEPFVPYPVSLSDNMKDKVSSLIWDANEKGSLFAVSPEKDGKLEIANAPSRFKTEKTVVDADCVFGSPLKWDEVIPMRVKTNSRILDSDILYMNKGIKDEFEDIEARAWEADVKSFSAMDAAMNLRYKREDLGIGENEKDIPAYAEAILGTSKTPDELMAEIDEDVKAAQAVRHDSMQDLFGRVSDLTLTDSRDFTMEVAGKNEHGQKNRLRFVSPETRNMLGPPFEQYQRKQVTGMMREIRAEFLGNSVMGIDVSRPVNDIQPVKETPEKSRDVAKSKPVRRYYDDLETGVKESDGLEFE